MIMDAQATHRKDLEVLQSLEQSTTVGRKMDVGGFVFGDSFDALLREVSEDYLAAAWTSLAKVMERHALTYDDLSWGCMHPGETSFFLDGNRVRKEPSSPSDFIGWMSCKLSEDWRTGDRNPSEAEVMDTELKICHPSLRCTATWRSLKWNIAPQNYELALKLIEILCTDEPSAWHPNVVLHKIVDPTEIWLKIADALRHDNQPYLDAMVAEARRHYSSPGFRIVIRGYQMYLRYGGHEGKATLPNLD
jgi:hypothetical protein